MGDEVKDDLRKFCLDTFGTLEETDDHYSFEQTMERFGVLLQRAVNTPPDRSVKEPRMPKVRKK